MFDRLPAPSSLSTTTAAQALGSLRSVIGAAMLAMPSALPRVLGADATNARRLGYLVRMVGVREIALGVGTWQALALDDDLRPWLLAQLVSDAGDAASIGLAVRAGRANKLTGAVIIVFALGGVAFDAWVDRAVRAQA